MHISTHNTIVDIQKRNIDQLKIKHNFINIVFNGCNLKTNKKTKTNQQTNYKHFYVFLGLVHCSSYQEWKKQKRGAASSLNVQTGVWLHSKDTSNHVATDKELVFFSECGVWSLYLFGQHRINRDFECTP